MRKNWHLTLMLIYPKHRWEEMVHETRYPWYPIITTKALSAATILWTTRHTRGSRSQWYRKKCRHNRIMRHQRASLPRRTSHRNTPLSWPRLRQRLEIPTNCLPLPKGVLLKCRKSSIRISLPIVTHTIHRPRRRFRSPPEEWSSKVSSRL